MASDRIGKKKRSRKQVQKSVLIFPAVYNEMRDEPQRTADSESVSGVTSELNWVLRVLKISLNFCLSGTTRF